MNFEMEHIYHVYNRSNERVFYSNENYLFFIEKMRKNIYPHCEILAWCLMPNHFHILLQANQISEALCKEKHRPSLQTLSKNFGTLLSSYTQALNKAKKRKGKLFAHNTEAKLVTLKGNDYLKWCFYYIHQNPKRAGLVQNSLDWDYSSGKDYAGIRNGKLCNIKLVQEMLDITAESFIADLQRGAPNALSDFNPMR